MHGRRELRKPKRFVKPVHFRIIQPTPRFRRPADENRRHAVPPATNPSQTLPAGLTRQVEVQYEQPQRRAPRFM